MAEFYEVNDRDTGRLYALMALATSCGLGLPVRTGGCRTCVCGWWTGRCCVIFAAMKSTSYRNKLVSVPAHAVVLLARNLPRLTARWVVDSYKAETERLTSTQLGLPLDPHPRPATDPQLVELVRRSPTGTWVQARTFAADKSQAARTWASEVRRGKKARLATLGPLEAHVERRQQGYVVMVRRAGTSAAIIDIARRLAEIPHDGQVDKAGRLLYRAPEACRHAVGGLQRSCRYRVGCTTSWRTPGSRGPNRV